MRQSMKRKWHVRCGGGGVGGHLLSGEMAVCRWSVLGIHLLNHFAIKSPTTSAQAIGCRGIDFIGECGPRYIA